MSAGHKPYALGKDRWDASRPYYDSLSLASDGIGWEQAAVHQFGVDKRLPQLEQFWKFHVCPATDRPNGVSFNPGVNEDVSLLVQRNYTILMSIFEALDLLDAIRKGDLGIRRRNVHCCLKYAGDALQVFTELQATIRTLSGNSVFPDFWTDPKWGARRDETIRYRNYLTHEGYLFCVIANRSGSDELLVLKRSAMLSMPCCSWPHTEARFKTNEADFIPIQQACAEVVEETIVWLDDAYERANSIMDVLLPNRAYQAKWGWKDGFPQPHEKPKPAAVPVAAGTAVKASGSTPAWMCGSTAEGAASLFNYGSISGSGQIQVRK